MQELTINQEHLNLLLLPNDKQFYTVSQAAIILNKSVQFIRDSIKSGELNAIIAPGRTLNKDQKRNSISIHRDHIITYLLTHSTMPEKYYLELIKIIALKTPLSLLLELYDAIGKKLEMPESKDEISESIV